MELFRPFQASADTIPAEAERFLSPDGLHSSYEEILGNFEDSLESRKSLYEQQAAFQRDVEVAIYGIPLGNLTTEQRAAFMSSREAHMAHLAYDWANEPAEPAENVPRD